MRFFIFLYGTLDLSRPVLAEATPQNRNRSALCPNFTPCTDRIHCCSVKLLKPSTVSTNDQIVCPRSWRRSLRSQLSLSGVIVIKRLLKLAEGCSKRTVIFKMPAS
jgi:hypothetical protein